MNANRKIIGALAELVGAVYFMLKGYRVLLRDWRGQHAQVDLVVLKGETLSLVEVKWRRGRDKAHIAIHPAQRERLLKQATALHSRYKSKTVQCDALLIFPVPPFVEYVPNAWQSGTKSANIKQKRAQRKR